LAAELPGNFKRDYDRKEDAVTIHTPLIIFQKPTKAGFFTDAEDAKQWALKKERF
jgi:hypothetical protein